ncbi:hypothetical protein N7535_003396 [Penicillium sp. DV-2018c]|nr:hypothetical protein N7535_003396 [Penicillium sp. DV-2018c]
MDREEAPPPPYSPTDPLLAPDTRNGVSQAPIPLVGNVSPSQGASSSRNPALPTVVPTQFTSAAAYFEERVPSILDESRELLQHHMTIYPRSQAKDYPRRPRCLAARYDEITQQDWDTFLKYLFPPHLGLAASSRHLPRQLRAEISRDRKDRPQESDEQRRARIAAVVAEWNECFFGFRGARIVFVYVGEPHSAPSSALCPRCYPAATGSTEGLPARQANAPLPIPGQHVPSQTPWQMPAPPNPHVPVHPSPYAPYGVAPYPPSVSPNQPPQYHPIPQPHGVWQYNQWTYPQQQPQYNNNNNSSKGGSLGWISQLASQAQKYGERFSEQALLYGDQISAQAQHYGRQVEEQALAHARWIEEQARLHGRKAPMTGAPYGGYYGQAAWVNWPRPMTHVPTMPIQTPSPVASPNTVARVETTSQTMDSDKPKALTEQHRPEPPAAKHTRRASVSSTSSESSFSSIDSISTTSDLGISDLATVRTQLELLDDRHDRILYEAAVELRRQLSILRESRREAKFSGKNWRAGYRQNQPNNSQSDDTDWGRWDSPEQQERNSVDRRAMKEELRATKKAFRETIRRAREEQRDRRRSRRRQARNHRDNDSDKDKDKAKEKFEKPLEQQLGTLRLEDRQSISNQSVSSSPAEVQARAGPMPVSNGSVGFGFASHAHTVSQASTQESTSGASAGSGKREKPGDTSSRLKGIFLPRKGRKHQSKGEDDDEGK